MPAEERTPRREPARPEPVASTPPPPPPCPVPLLAPSHDDDDPRRVPSSDR